jgi:pSer/pThr/pTyr-binding forkhead associated (FHA) protein
MFEVFLLVLSGPLKGHKYLVKADVPILIGRSPEADINISYDDYCSRKHASIRILNNKFVIEDLNSTNGTYVNGKKIEGEWMLSDGDIITFGQTKIVLRMQKTNQGQ